MPRTARNTLGYYEALTELARRRDQITTILARHGYGDVPLSEVLKKMNEGNTLSAAKRRGRPPMNAASSATGSTGTIVESKPERSSARKRGPKGSAAAFVLSILAEKPLATAEINALWKRTRSGVADNYLTSLTKSGQIKRSPNPSGRGSQFSLA